MFNICLANINIGIDNKYPYIENMCRDYITSDDTDFTVSVTDAEIMREDDGSGADAGYLETLAVYRKIADKIIDYNGFLMHGVIIDVDGVGTAFLAKSGTGKTTHMCLWKQLLGDRMTVVNGDKPLVRIIDGKVYAYGTPWAGKENIHCNTRTSLDNICILKRATENECIELSKDSVFVNLFTQVYRPVSGAAVAKTIDLLNEVINTSSFYEIRCNMDLSAAKTAYEKIFETF